MLAITGAVTTIVSLFCLRETYPPVLLQRKTARLIRETGNAQLRSRLDTGGGARQLFWRSIVRPAKLLLLSPIVLAMSLYTGVAYGYMYLMFSTFTEVFEAQYGFPAKSTGLTFLGLGVGSLLGVVGVGAASDRLLKAKSRASGGMKPEYRLPPLVVGSVFMPAGLFMYGWSAQEKVHWIVPIIGTALVGIGTMAVFMCVISYLVDAFTIYAASALAANTVVRSIMGALLPLAGASMYASLGLGWGNSLLGFVALACIPVPSLLLKYGERMRKSFDASRL